MPQSLDIDSLIREKGSEILQFLQQKQEEMDILYWKIRTV